jgi:hypothetical protein
VPAAFQDLMPPEIRGKRTARRQGEWFLHSVEEKDLPEAYVTIPESSSGDGNTFILPKDDPDANDHTVYCEAARITPEGIFALSPRVTHDQHQSISGTGWIKFLKNTAVRSVSVEGVD